jgi:glycosyltransferase involved in cell wall biosynthesis
MNTRATIVITYFNEKKFLNDAVKSALSQKCDYLFDVLVIDDGGLVPASEILTPNIKNNERVKILRQENCGLGAARDTGIKNAKGDFVTFLDADDTIETHKLAEQLKAIDRYKLINSVLFTGTKLLPGNKYKWCDLKEKSDILDISDEVLKGKQPSGASMIISKNLYFKVGGFEEKIRRNCEDCLIAKLFAIGTKFYVIPKPLYIQNESAESNRHSTKYRLESLERCLSNSKKYFESHQKGNYFAVFFRRRIRSGLKTSINNRNYKYSISLITLLWKNRIFKKGEIALMLTYVLINICSFSLVNRTFGFFHSQFLSQKK